MHRNNRELLFFFFLPAFCLQMRIWNCQHSSACFSRTWAVCCCSTNTKMNKAVIYMHIQLISVSWYRHVSYEYEPSTQPRYPDAGIGTVASLAMTMVVARHYHVRPCSQRGPFVRLSSRDQSAPPSLSPSMTAVTFSRAEISSCKNSTEL